MKLYISLFLFSYFYLLSLCNPIYADQKYTLSRLVPFPIQDGNETTTSNKIVNDDLLKSLYISLKIPVSTWDGDVNYQITISPQKPDSQYNIVYIIDTSSSMSSKELKDVQKSYIDSIKYLIDNGVGNNSNFGIVFFDEEVILQKNLTADEAIIAIQNLKISDSNTYPNYDRALKQSEVFLEQSPLDRLKVQNIIYFFAKDLPQINQVDARQIKENVEIKTFSVQKSSNINSKLILEQLNELCFATLVIIGETSELKNAIRKSGLSEKIAEIKILLNGKIVETIQSEQLADTLLGLTFKGSIDGLDISNNAENIVTAEVIFNDQLQTKSINSIVTSGHATGVSSSSKPGSLDNILYGSNRNDDIVLGGADLGADGKLGNDTITGNKRDNILNGDGGDDDINAYKGNDTITTGEGRDLVNGGEGIDTVIYQNKLHSNSSIRQAGNTVNVDYTDTLINVEFIQFSDVRISTKTLNVTPILTGKREIIVREGDSITTTIPLIFELSSPASTDVKFDYTTMNIEDIDNAGSSQTETISKDYVAKSGRATILAGETQVAINLEVIGDDIEQKERSKVFALQLSNISGATFAENVSEEYAVIYIEDDDKAFRINAGSSENYIDSYGQQWYKSESWISFVNGQTNLTPNEIAQTEDDVLYQSEYLGDNFSFSFPVFVPNCSYEVTLKFAEINFDRVNQRIFDVFLEDKQIINNLDIFRAAKGKNIPISRTFNILVQDNSLDINFVAETGQATVSAIKIKPNSADVKECSWF